MANYPVTMYDFHVWANQTMINRLKELPREVYTQEITSVFPTVSKALAHIYLVDSAWLSILSGVEMRDALSATFERTAQAEALGLEELEALYQEVSSGIQAFIREHADLEQTIVLDNPYTSVRDTSYGEILLQIVNHGTYHRGNITAMLRQMGHASTMTEYALYWYAKE
ncbi:DinB family protein [Brevibacillus choshinensis]|uniref:DinB family protein n=1 Tax=Brevibacillus choshinensis TaxID=54911 RepID=A0ABX7FTI4_BRECH|nr:DinB family protein [Brevibacillus choshinensis]QRG69029.1 DinB family protein [Brevibacillus choshinensis]